MSKIVVNNVVDEWVGMPEYNNVKQPKPVIIVEFKFRTETDYIEFKDKIQEHLFDGEKPFDGMQRLDKKNTWFPHNEKASRYLYVDGEGK